MVMSNGQRVAVTNFATLDDLLAQSWGQATTFGGVTDGRKTVAAAGTAERMSANFSCKSVVLTAETDNAGTVVVGGASVVAALSTRRGTPLTAGQSLTLPVNNLNLVWLDVTTSGDGVTYTCLL